MRFLFNVMRPKKAMILLKDIYQVNCSSHHVCVRCMLIRGNEPSDHIIQVWKENSSYTLT